MKSDDHTNHIVKQGYLDLLLPTSGEPKQWCNRYCVLNAGGVDFQARLAWYTSESHHQEDEHEYQVIYVEEIIEFEIPPRQAGADRAHVIDIELTRDRRLGVSAGNGDELVDWVDAFLEVRHIPHVQAAPCLPRSKLDYEIPLVSGTKYDVTIEATDAAKRNALPSKGHLVVGTYEILLMSTDERALLKWDFVGIRRCGGGRRSFSLESGRNCLAGHGLFTFQTTNDAETLRTDVKNKIDALVEAKENRSVTRVFSESEA